MISESLVLLKGHLSTFSIIDWEAGKDPSRGILEFTSLAKKKNAGLPLCQHEATGRKNIPDP